MKHHSHQKIIAFSKVLLVIAFMIVLNLFCWHSTTHAAPANITLTPQRDKYVENAAGINDDLIFVAGKHNNGTAEGVLGFDISQISGPVTSAVLKINVVYSMDINDPPLRLRTYMNIYGSNTDDWAENDASIPSKDQMILSSQYVDRAQTYTYDVTDFLQSQTDGYATFVLEPRAETVYRYFYFYSSDGYYASGASLIINYLDPVATLSGSALNENNVNGGTVNIALEDTAFTDGTLDKGNFTLTGGIDGLSVSSVNYTDETHCSLTLAYNGKDFDTDFSFGVVIDETELTALNDLEASNVLTVAAVNDSESLSLSYDGTINEGAEDGEVITVTLTGGQLSGTINPNNWTLGNLPGGVSKGSVTRIDDHTVRITLSGNATYDYDVDITNMSVSCTVAEYGDSTGGGTITGSTGVRFTADNNPETLTLSDNGDITEDHEHDKTFIATLSGGQFANTLNGSNWSISGQPYGCHLSSTIERLDDHHVRLKIYGLTQVDYDSDITNVTVSCTSAEYRDSTGDGTLSGTGITFHATNDAESFYTQSYNGQTIYEGQENDKVIWALIFGGKFPWTVNPAHWSVSSLPDGVSCTIVKEQSYTPMVNITLLGNATQDYDIDRVLTITCSADGYTDGTGVGPLSSSSVSLTAFNDPESISISDDGGISEGAEDGEIITVTLTGGTFPESINPDNWTVANLPEGVTKGTVTRVDSQTVQIALSGNAQIDYDTDITNVSVTCGITEYNDHTGGGSLICSSGVRLIADNDAEVLSAGDDGLIEEGTEDGEVITATLTGGIFSNPINAANWTLAGLPDGVSKGSVTRVDNHHVEICLSGNTSVDYDSDLSEVSVICTADEYSGTLRTSLSVSGITIKAIDDAESIAISSGGAIAEGSEDGKTIDVALTGGRFVSTLTPENWTLEGLPEGVAKGTITRMDDWHVSIMLSGNASTDFDSDITDMSVTCTADEYMDHTGGDSLTCHSGVRFEAVDDAESLSILDDGLITEGAENGEIITAILAGGVFSETVNPSNWSITGQPEGVSIGTVTRIDNHTVAVRLSGVSEADYDSDMTAARVICTAEEYMDHTGNDALMSNAGVRFTAINDAESIAISDDGLITEGAEDGEIIRVTLSGGVFSNPVNADHWTVAGLPSGVEKGAVTRIDRHTVAIKLSGNSDIDYDIDMTSISVSCTDEEYSGSSNAALTANSGVVLKAVNDLESLSASAAIIEGEEDGSVITVKISGGSFVAAIRPENWSVVGLPLGVEKGAVKRIDSRTVTISIKGSAAYDYDKDINISVTCTPDEYIGTLRIPLTASGIAIKAVDDPEVLTLSDSRIKEGHEDGETIIVKISGGQFAEKIDAQHWTVDNMPIGVSIGSITRTDAHTVVLTLAGKSAKDYDKDITNVKVTCEADQYHAGDIPLSAQSGVVFDAIVEKDTSQQIEDETSASQSPTPTPSSMPSTQPAVQPSGSGQETETVSENRDIKATLIHENKDAGTILIEFDASSLPSGTVIIRLADGTQIDIKGTGGTVQLEVSIENLNEYGELIMEALDDEGIPLISLNIKVMDQNSQLIPVGSETMSNRFTLLWVLAGILGFAAVVLVSCLVWKKRKLN